MAPCRTSSPTRPWSGSASPSKSRCWSAAGPSCGRNRPPASAGRGTSPPSCGCWDPAWKSGGSASSAAGPKGLRHVLPPIPLRDPFSLFVVSGLSARAEDSWFVPSVTPLDKEAEEFYQFRSGDTISVQFAGGSVQAVSVTAHPRAQHLGLVFAVLWIRARNLRGGADHLSARKAHRLGVQLFAEGAVPCGARKRCIGARRWAMSRPHRRRVPDCRAGVLNYALNALMRTRMEIGVPVAVVDLFHVEPPLLASKASELCTLRHHRGRMGRHHGLRKSHDAGGSRLGLRDRASLDKCRGSTGFRRRRPRSWSRHGARRETRSWSGTARSPTPVPW